MIGYITSSQKIYYTDPALLPLTWTSVNPAKVSNPNYFTFLNTLDGQLIAMSFMNSVPYTYTVALVDNYLVTSNLSNSHLILGTTSRRDNKAILVPEHLFNCIT